MFGLLCPLVFGGIAGLLRARSTTGLHQVRVLWWPLAVVSLGAQLVLFNPPIDRQPWALVGGPWIWVGCLVAMFVVLARNAIAIGPQRAAWSLAALGVAANLVVVVANGGLMPQSPEARLAVRGRPLVTEGAPVQLRNVAPAGPDTRLVWLGDVIPQPTWLPAANVVSAGDLLMTIALAWWSYSTLAIGSAVTHRRSE